MSRLLRSAALAILCVAAMAGAFIVRALHEGEAELLKSDVAFNQGALDESLRAARRAAVWAVPGAPHVEAAYARMRAIALGAETAGKRELARRAWTAIRGAVLETRSPFASQQRRLEEANSNVARLLASKGLRRGHADITAGWLESRYATPPVSLGWSLFAGGAFASMVLGSLWLLWGAHRGRHWAAYFPAAVVLAGGLCVWVWVAIQS